MMWNRKLFKYLLPFLLGLLTVFGLRFIFVKNEAVHYHANFGLYVNGKQDKFNNFTFYEEVAVCSNDHADPKHRAHMHDNNNHVIHVHDDSVTWGDFFANLGYGVTNKSFTTDNGVFVDATNGNKLTFILNGQKADSVANKVIQSEDVLLISYGNEDQTELQKRYDAVPKDAPDFNAKTDPATCAGNDSLTFTHRLKRAISLN